MTERPELSIAFQTNKTSREYAELASLVESFGFDVLSMYSDLGYQPPIVPLAIAAAATSRIRLGPASLNPFTLHPMEIAGQIATLDEASAGRAYLGISRGAWLGSIGVRQEHPVQRVIDAINAVNYLLEGQTGGFTGQTVMIDPGVTLRYARERQAVPILLGSWGPKLIGASARLVDEIKLGGSANPDMVAVALEWSVDSPKTRIVLGAVTIVDEDRAVARQAIRREMALYLPVVAPLDPTVDVDRELLQRIEGLVARGETNDAARLIPESLIQRFAFAGTPGDIVDQCLGIFESGASRIEFGTPHGTSSQSGIALLGEHVLPAIRAAL